MTNDKKTPKEKSKPKKLTKQELADIGLLLNSVVVKGTPREVTPTINRITQLQTKISSLIKNI